MGVYLLTDVMRAALLLLPLLAGVHSRGLKFGPIAEANHNAKSTLGCDPDYGWSDGAEGSGKCYMLIKNFDYSTCYSDGGVGGYGMSWFDAMECCYYNKGYLAEPQSADEQAKIGATQSAGGPGYPPYPPQGGGGGYPPYPPATGGGYPQPQPVGRQDSMTGTVTAEHLTASIRSAVEDKVRRGLREQVEEKNAEMQVLKRTGEELSQGQSRLKELVERMKREEEEVDRDTAILQQKKSELETLQERAAEEEPLDPDEAVEAGAPLFRQLTTAYSEENAVEDALYFLGRALGNGALDCEGYLKQVRVLSRRQFLLRETMVP